MTISGDVAPVLKYIDEYWSRIIRQVQKQEATLIGLPRPYLVPSDGPMFREMYYWDSYFMSLGLLGTRHEQLIVDMVENLGTLFRRFGVIPNASRFYFLSRSQPPFFTSLIWLAYEVKCRQDELDARRFLRQMMRLAEQEHETVWMGTGQPHHRQVFRELSRYFDINYLDILASCESGWDHSTRCDDRWLEHLPVDLNSILYARERDFAKAADLLGMPSRASHWNQVAERRRETIQELMWNEEVGFFFDYDWVKECGNSHPSLAGFYPLWAGLATREQADRIVRDWLPQFEYPGGLVTTMEEREGRQWAYPNGWAPLQWLVVTGLERYGFSAAGRRIREKWLANCIQVFEATGFMWEKYNVVEVGAFPQAGLYGSVAGFGWSNAVFSDFVRQLGP